jgi:hypothetical protein
MIINNHISEWLKMEEEFLRLIYLMHVTKKMSRPDISSPFKVSMRVTLTVTSIIGFTSNIMYKKFLLLVIAV